MSPLTRLGYVVEDGDEEGSGLPSCEILEMKDGLMKVKDGFVVVLVDG